MTNFILVRGELVLTLDFYNQHNIIFISVNKIFKLVIYYIIYTYQIKLFIIKKNNNNFIVDYRLLICLESLNYLYTFILLLKML